MASAVIGRALVTPRLMAEAGVVAQRVHQPRLAGGTRADQRLRLLRERLPGRVGVLRQQGPYLPLREVARRSDSDLMLNALPPSTSRFSAVEWIR